MERFIVMIVSVKVYRMIKNRGAVDGADIPIN